MVVETERQWLKFLDTLTGVMIKFQNDKKFSMSEAYSSLYEFDGVINSEIIEFVENTISEIGGFPTGYSEVLILAQNKVSQDDFKSYMMR